MTDVQQSQTLGFVNAADRKVIDPLQGGAIMSPILAKVREEAYRRGCKHVLIDVIEWPIDNRPSLLLALSLVWQGASYEMSHVLCPGALPLALIAKHLDQEIAQLTGVP